MPLEAGVVIGTISLGVGIVSLYLHRDSPMDLQDDLNRELSGRGHSEGQMTMSVDRVQVRPEDSWKYRIARIWWWKDIEGASEVSFYTGFSVEEGAWDSLDKMVDVAREELDDPHIPGYEHQFTTRVGPSKYQHLFTVDSLDSEEMLALVFILLKCIRFRTEEGDAEVMRKMGDLEVPAKENVFEF